MHNSLLSFLQKPKHLTQVKQVNRQVMHSHGHTNMSQSVSQHSILIRNLTVEGIHA